MSAALLLSVLLAALAARVIAQESEVADPGDEQPLEGFAEVLDVEIVNIDVWVTERSGEPIEGLQRDDFVVTRDRRPVEITNFYAVAGGRPVAEPAPEPADAGDPAEPIAPIARFEREVPPEHRLWLVVYIDNSNIDVIDRRRVMPAVRDFVARTVGDGDRVMVVTYSRSLSVRLPFTEHLDSLMAALDEVSEESGFAAIRNRERAETLHEIDDTNDGQRALSAARRFADSQMDDARRTADALEELISSLAGLPGRKAVLHVSSGVPILPGQEVFEVVGEKYNMSEAYAEIPRYDLSSDLERVARQANAHRVAFHALDAAGLRNLEFGKAEYQGFAHPRIRRTLDSVVPENLQGSVRFVSGETGGQAVLNQNDPGPGLHKITTDLQSFYSLGISSAGATSGRYHEIKVELRERRPGVTIRHRGGYRSKDLTSRVRDSLRAALLYGHDTNPHDITVRWGDPRDHEGGKAYLLPIEISVPLRDIVILPVADGVEEARLQLFVAAVGEGAAISPIDTTPFGVRLAPEHVEAARGESLVHTHRLLVGPGRSKVGLAVLDRFGLQSSIVTGLVEAGVGLDIAPPGS